VPAGFEAHPDGWGFRAVRPASACAGATRAVIGQRDCAPLDDCGASFPPARASIVVSTASPGTYGGVPIVATLEEAMARAEPSATIAVDRGTYDGVTASRDVKVVGRCAAETIVSGPAPSAFSTRGVTLDVRSLTIQGFGYGIRASGGTTHVANVLFRDNTIAASANGAVTLTIEASAVEHPGLMPKSPSQAFESLSRDVKLVVVGCDVRDVAMPLFAGKGSSIEVRRTLMQNDDETPSALFILAGYDAKITIEESVMKTRARAIAMVGNAKYTSQGKSDSSQVTIRASTLEQSGGDSDEFLLAVQGSATLNVEGSTIRHRSKAAFNAWEAGSRLVVKDVTAVAEAPKSTQNETGVIDEAASADIDGLAAIGGTAGISVMNSSTLALRRSLIARPNRPGSTLSYGVLAVKEAEVQVDASTLTDCADAALELDSQAHAEILRTLVRGTKRTSRAPGSAVLAMGEAQIVVSECLLVDNEGAGVDVWQAGGVVATTRIVRNTTGVSYGESNLLQGKDAVTGRGPRDLVLFDDAIDDNGSAVVKSTTWTVNVSK